MSNQMKSHWEQVYATHTENEVSWTQFVPQTSLDFIHSFNIPKTASIIDVGGGDSRLVDYLLNEGFTNLTVLDISEQALVRAKKRLGEKASLVNWIEADIADFQPEEVYDVWHDRATFHFLQNKTEVERYIQTAARYVNGYLSIATFSESGPEKCSGLPVKKYSEDALAEIMSTHFKKIRCITEDHITPFQTRQNFTFCSFQTLKRAA